MSEKVTAKFLCEHFNNKLASRLGIKHRFSIGDKNDAQLANELQAFCVDNVECKKLGFESFSWCQGVEMVIRNDLTEAKAKNIIRGILTDDD